MSTGRDDDALSWGGDDDPTLDVGARPGTDPERAAAPLPDGFTAVGRGSGDLAATQAADPSEASAASAPASVGVEDDGDVDAPPRGLSSAMLVTVGVVAGVYLLYTVGWIVGGLRLAGTAEFLVSPVGYRFALWLAVAAPALWFGTVFLLTRASATWIRVVWLVVGLALLVPWPFIMVGAVGQ